MQPTQEHIRLIVEAINQHLTMPVRYGIKENSPAITCLDGTSISVQASLHHYCSPRDNYAPWDEVEVWCIHNKGQPVTVTEFPYSESEPTGRVPIEKVALFIFNHSGFVIESDINPILTLKG